VREVRCCSFVLVGAILLACCGIVETPTSPEITCEHPAPLYNAVNPIPRQYVVRIRDEFDVGATANELAGRYDMSHVRVLTPVYHGFAAEMDKEVAEALRCETAVREIWEDSEILL
jgi:hypothetical protein